MRIWIGVGWCGDIAAVVVVVVSEVVVVVVVACDANAEGGECGCVAVRDADGEGFGGDIARVEVLDGRKVWREAVVTGGGVEFEGAVGA